ncbi:MAG: helix-turn-helix domain-containing protein [Erysipelotrichaceae bacterium]
MSTDKQKQACKLNGLKHIGVISDYDVVVIKHDIDSGMALKEVAKMYKVSVSYISKIYNGHRKNNS